MKRLLKLIAKQWITYTLGFVALVSAIVLDMYNPYYVGEIIDRVILGGELAYLRTALLALAVITFGRAVLGYTKEYMFDISSSKVIVELRKKLFDHIQKLSFAFFDRNNTGELMSRIKEDTENIMHAICFGIMLFLEQIIYFVTATVILLTINWKLALVSLVTMPLIEYVVFRLERQVGRQYERISDQRAVLNMTAQENIAGVRVVKAFGREKHEILKFLRQNEENYKINYGLVRSFAKYNPLIEFLSNLVLVLVITAGGYLVIGGEMTLGTLVAFSNYIWMLIWPMRMLGWLTSVLAQCVASVKKVNKLFDEEPDIKNCPEPKVPEKVRGHVEFRDVCFDYDGVSVLENINIDAKPGSMIAIMGMTGAGKTTLINLIGRYYDCTSGSVCLDGVDVRKWTLRCSGKMYRSLCRTLSSFRIPSSRT